MTSIDINQKAYIKARLCSLIKKGYMLYSIVTYFHPDLRIEAIKILAQMYAENDILLGLYSVYFQGDSATGFSGYKGQSVSDAFQEIVYRLRATEARCSLKPYDMHESWGDLARVHGVGV